MRNATIPIEMDFIRATARAVEFDYEGEQLWVPLSQIEGFDPDGHDMGDRVTVDVPEWILKREGFI